MWGEKAWSPFLSTNGLIAIYPIWLDMGSSFCPAQLNVRSTRQETVSLLSAHDPLSWAALKLLGFLWKDVPTHEILLQAAKLLWKTELISWFLAKSFIWKCCTRYNSVQYFKDLGQDMAEVGLLQPKSGLQQWILLIAFLGLYLWFCFVTKHYKSLWSWRTQSYEAK